MDKQNRTSSLSVHIIPISENIIRVVYNHSKEEPGTGVLVSKDYKTRKDSEPVGFVSPDGSISFQNKQGEVVLREIGRSLTEKEIYTYHTEGEPVIKYEQTADGETAVIENVGRRFAGTSYEGRLVFAVTEEQGLYGLGQHEDGVYNYSGKREYLYQANMKITIPFLISSKNYGILVDTECAMIFDSRQGEFSFMLDTTEELSYYVITGENFEEIIRELRELTGGTPMLPRWAYGYVQCKERYISSEDLIQTANRFRESGIPIDCLVQDWKSWEEGLWGEKRVDKQRFPDLKGLLDTLHGENLKLMVSIWPRMAEGGGNYREFKEKNLLLPNSMVYDAFSEEARAVYWKQCEDEWFPAGVDAWWCDSAEPFSGPDWNGETKRPEALRYQLIVENFKRHMEDWTRLNSYGLYHSQGIYENWRKTTDQKRVVNLIHGSYISGQRYGAILWSGDITAKWSTLKKQVTEGIKFCMSGMPYWTLDIGAFFVASKDKWEKRGCDGQLLPAKLWFWDGDYDDGVDDLGYRELYVRWLQYGAFLPMFRVHGTDTPREPWNFGNPGDMFYDAILKFIKLRYRLLPYIYSTAAAVTREHSTILRSLMFDFASDVNVKEISDSFMFGKAFLVCPVIEPMYFNAGSVPVTDPDRTRSVYLPEGAQWFDFWTDTPYAGGQTIPYSVSLDTIPLFVRAGSIVPISEPILYADEKKGETAEIRIYAGADGEFTLYNDEGDNYSYETGNFSAVHLTYKDDRKTLIFGKASGDFTYQEDFRIRLIGNGLSKVIGYKYGGKEETVSL